MVNYTLIQFELWRDDEAERSLQNGVLVHLPIVRSCAAQPPSLPDYKARDKPTE
jgi:hypothetical protein